MNGIMTIVSLWNRNKRKESVNNKKDRANHQSETRKKGVFEVGKVTSDAAYFLVHVRPP